MDYGGARPKTKPTPVSDHVLKTVSNLTVRIIEDKLCERWLDSLIDLVITENSLLDVVARGKSRLGPSPFRPIVTPTVLHRVPASRLPGPPVKADPYKQYPVVVAGSMTGYKTVLNIPGLPKPILVPNDNCPALKTSVTIKTVENIVTVKKIQELRQARHQTKFDKGPMGRTLNPQMDNIVVKLKLLERPSYCVKFVGPDVYEFAHQRFLNQDGFCWKKSTYHPMRLPNCIKDRTYLDWKEWPYVITRKGVFLYQFTRTIFCIQPDSMSCLVVHNLDLNMSVKIMVPDSCGASTEFSDSMQACRPNIKLLATAFGLNIDLGISKGLLIFLRGLIFGRHQIQELYAGSCLICGFTFCHLDMQVCFQCQDCDLYFASDVDLNIHQKAQVHCNY